MLLHYMYAAAPFESTHTLNAGLFVSQQSLGFIFAAKLLHLLFRFSKCEKKNLLMGGLHFSQMLYTSSRDFFFGGVACSCQLMEQEVI